MLSCKSLVVSVCSVAVAGNIFGQTDQSILQLAPSPLSSPADVLSNSQPAVEPFQSSQLVLSGEAKQKVDWLNSVASHALSLEAGAMSEVIDTNNAAFSWDNLWRQPTAIPVSVVPEPTTGALAALGALALAFARRRRK